MFHHLHNNTEMEKPLSKLLPHWLTLVFSRGVYGGQVFFVISGFVIAYSVRDMLVTPRSAANFILRRQIRLDPAYWIAVVISVASAAISVLFHPDRGARSCP